MEEFLGCTHGHGRNARNVAKQVFWIKNLFLLFSHVYQISYDCMAKLRHSFACGYICMHCGFLLGTWTNVIWWCKEKPFPPYSNLVRLTAVGSTWDRPPHVYMYALWLFPPRKVIWLSNQAVRGTCGIYLSGFHFELKKCGIFLFTQIYKVALYKHNWECCQTVHLCGLNCLGASLVML